MCSLQRQVASLLTTVDILTSFGSLEKMTCADQFCTARSAWPFFITISCSHDQTFMYVFTSNFSFEMISSAFPDQMLKIFRHFTTTPCFLFESRPLFLYDTCVCPLFVMFGYKLLKCLNILSVIKYCSLMFISLLSLLCSDFASNFCVTCV